MLSRVITGERFKPVAADWNELVTGAVAGRDSRGAGARGIPAQLSAPATILVRNGAASAMPRQGIMSLLSATTPFTGDALVESPILTGYIPVGSGEAFAIVLEPLGYLGSIGLAAVAGVVPCQIDVSDAGHTLATTQASNEALVSSDTAGVPIIWKESGTGRKWALVQLGSPTTATPAIGVGAIGAVTYGTGFDATGAGQFDAQFDTIVIDDAYDIDLDVGGATVMTIPADGVYLVHTSLIWTYTGGNVDRTDIQLFINGSPTTERIHRPNSYTGADAFTHETTYLLTLNEDDYLSFKLTAAAFHIEWVQGEWQTVRLR